MRAPYEQYGVYLTALTGSTVHTLDCFEAYCTDISKEQKNLRQQQPPPVKQQVTRTQGRQASALSNSSMAPWCSMAPRQQNLLYISLP
ncbi:hypothetical protein WJX82_002942 [Trebouxia sp. C0006]